MAELQIQNQPKGFITPPGITAIQCNNLTKRLLTLDDDGFVNVLGTGIASTVENSAALNTTETLLKTVRTPFIQVGSVFRITLTGTNTSTVANNSTFTGRIGVLGTTADPTMFTAVLASAAAGTGIPFKVVIEFTVRTIGIAGTLIGTAVVMNQGTTGISTLALNVITLTVSPIDTTLNNFISITYVSAAVTTTSTFTQTIIEQIR